MKKESILLLSLLTTSNVYSATSSENIKKIETELRFSEKRNYNLENLTELLNRRPINDDGEWQKKVDALVKTIYLNQKIQSVQNPTCATVE